MKKNLFLMLTLIVLSVASVKAQVNIGSDANPHSGAVLDLSQLPTGKELGLLLPNVALNAVLTEFVLPLTDPSTKANATGMMVYNTNPELSGGVGVYVWNGEEWKNVNVGGSGSTGGTGDDTYNPGNYPKDPPTGITLTLTGTTCYDVRTTLDPYATCYLAVEGAKSVDKVTWFISDPNGVQSEDSNPSGYLANLTLKPQGAVLALANGNGGTVQIIVTAYIDVTRSDDSKAKTSISKTIKFKNTDCCDGVIVFNAAFDYEDGTPGYISRTSGITISNTTDHPLIPNNGTFKSYSAGDLCVYKNMGPASQTWAAAVMGCMGGTGADGDGTSGWYLPNKREVDQIYTALGGLQSLVSSYSWSNLLTNGQIVAASPVNMPGLGNYLWASDELSATQAASLFPISSYAWGQANSKGSTSIKFSSTTTYYPTQYRCVKRL
ncbi:MAG: hypothetical protein LBO74_09850 [Candidatus Symbiothrix sp.]|nr:hypothetical protein [Candidatus Symbiothrix sp.]